jgi:hypothetical protein
MSLLDLLFGGANAPAQADHSWTTDPDGYLTPVNNNQNTPAPAAPVAPATPQGSQSQAPIVVDGPMRDQWHPHKRSTLGTVADFALAALGLPIFPFGHKNKNQNVQEALSGYEANPMQAIHRLAQIKGEEGNAVKLAQDYDEGEAKKDNYARMNDVLQLQKDKYVTGLALNMMGAVNDPTTYGAMRTQAINYGQRYNTDLGDMIPLDYDKNWVEVARTGAVPVSKQISTAEQVRNHGLQHEDRVEGHQIQRAHNAVTEQQGSARIGISRYNADTGRMNAGTAARNEQDREKSIDKQPNNNLGRNFVYTMKNGIELKVQVAKDGKTAIAHDPQGNPHEYMVVNGTLVPTKRKPK